MNEGTLAYNTIKCSDRSIEATLLGNYDRSTDWQTQREVSLHITIEEANKQINAWQNEQIKK